MDSRANRKILETLIIGFENSRNFTVIVAELI